MNQILRRGLNTETTFSFQNSPFLFLFLAVKKEDFCLRTGQDPFICFLHYCIMRLFGSMFSRSAWDENQNNSKKRHPPFPTGNLFQHDASAVLEYLIFSTLTNIKFSQNMRRKISFFLYRHYQPQHKEKEIVRQLEWWVTRLGRVFLLIKETMF